MALLHFARRPATRLNCAVYILVSRCTRGHRYLHHPLTSSAGTAHKPILAVIHIKSEIPVEITAPVVGCRTDEHACSRIFENGFVEV
jgi:hypothetical protein